MTLDEALLYDAEWWFDTTKDCKLTTSKLYDIGKARRKYSDFKWLGGSDETQMYFNLLIREAVKDET